MLSPPRPISTRSEYPATWTCAAVPGEWTAATCCSGVGAAGAHSSSDTPYLPALMRPHGATPRHRKDSAPPARRCTRRWRPGGAPAYPPLRPGRPVPDAVPAAVPRPGPDHRRMSKSKDGSGRHHPHSDPAARVDPVEREHAPDPLLAGHGPDPVVAGHRPDPVVAGHGPDPARWRILGVALAAVFMSLIAVSIINVVLPAIQIGLDATDSDLQWRS